MLDRHMKTCLTPVGLLVFVLALFQPFYVDGQTTTPNLIRAEEYRKKGEWDNAITYYTSAIDKEEGKGLSTLVAIIYRGRCHAYFNKNEFDKAISDCTRSIELNPVVSDVYHIRASSRRRKGQIDLAIADLTKAIELEPRYADGYVSRGIAYSDKGDLDKAISDYTTALQKEPNSADVYILRGMLYRKLGDYDRAESDYLRAVQLQPESVDAFIGAGLVSFHKREYDLAIANLTRAIQIDPSSFDAFLFRGNAKVAMGNYDDAIGDYSKVIQINASYHLGYVARARAYSKKGEYAAAIKDHTKALELVPDDVETLYQRTWTNLYANDGKAAYEDAVHFLQLNGSKKGFEYIVLAGYLGVRKIGKTNDAKTFLTKWISQGDSTSWSLNLMKYFDGVITRDQLLTLSTDNKKLTESRTYIGELLLLESKTSDAVEQFKWVTSNGEKSFTEYELAKAELKRIGGSPPK